MSEIREIFYLKKEPNVTKKKVDFSLILRNKVLANEIFDEFFDLYPDAEVEQVLRDEYYLSFIKSIYLRKLTESGKDKEIDYSPLELFYKSVSMCDDNKAYTTGAIMTYYSLFEEIHSKFINYYDLINNYMTLEEFLLSKSNYIGKYIKKKENKAMDYDSILLYIGKYLSLISTRTIYDHKHLCLISNTFLQGSELYGQRDNSMRCPSLILKKVNEQFSSIKKK